MLLARPLALDQTAEYDLKVRPEFIVVLISGSVSNGAVICGTVKCEMNCNRSLESLIE